MLRAVKWIGGIAGLSEISALTGALFPNPTPSYELTVSGFLKPTLHAQGFLQAGVILDKFLDAVGRAHASPSSGGGRPASRWSTLAGATT
jgi:hypothetical protein